MPVDIGAMTVAEIDQRIHKVEMLARLWRRQVAFLAGQVEDADRHRRRAP
jgi:hypothetical protein